MNVAVQPNIGLHYPYKNNTVERRKKGINVNIMECAWEIYTETGIIIYINILFHNIYITNMSILNGNPDEP